MKIYVTYRNADTTEGRVTQFTERAHSYADVRAHLGY